MPRKPDPNKEYLAEYRGNWRVSIHVPKPLQAQLGTRLVRGLDTTSIVLARTRSQAIIREFQKRIADAWDAQGGKKDSRIAEAMELRRELQGATGQYRALIEEQINAGAKEIMLSGRRGEVEGDDPDDWGEIFDPEVKRQAREYRQIASGKLTPIVALHPEYMQSLKIKDRSKLDEPRALNLLLDWMRTRPKPIPPHIERLGREEVQQFVDWLQESSDLSWASKVKHLGRLKVYWKWLAKRNPRIINYFHDQTIKRERVEGEQEERAYTDTEVQRLFMGKPQEGRAMLDVMAVAALTGARLDAVVDLKVDGCAQGIFKFKKQKKEKDERHVPIHPDLHEIVARRIKGLPPTADLFPDWPGPKPPSKKPRSSYFSKRFSEFSSDIGVRDEVEGKRRSLVNFHSFRRWFITKLERAGVNGDLIAAIVGHKRAGLSLGHYSSGPELQAALDAISLVKLPPLDGTPIVEARGLRPLRERAS